MKIVSPLVFSLTLFGCSNGAYSVAAAPSKIVPSSARAAERVGAPNANASAKPGPEATLAIDPCQKERKILIIDLKSGWFAGDGGDFFNKMTNDACGGLVKIHYVHFTSASVQTNINLQQLADCPVVFNCRAMKDLKSYDQFWVLSGDESDGADVRLNSPLFQSILIRAVELRDANPKAGFYFGAGLGNIHHSNALAKKLFPEIAGNSLDPDSGIFSAGTDANRGTLPDSNYPAFIHTSPLTSGSGTAAGTFNASALPFAAFGPYKSAMSLLFDYKNDSNSAGYLPTCFSDKVSPAGAGLSAASFRVIAKDPCGIEAIATASLGQHSVVIDGNTARHYGYANDAGEYFHRVILSMLR